MTRPRISNLKDRLRIAPQDSGLGKIIELRRGDCGIRYNVLEVVVRGEGHLSISLNLYVSDTGAEGNLGLDGLLNCLDILLSERQNQEVKFWPERTPFQDTGLFVSDAFHLRQLGLRQRDLKTYLAVFCGEGAHHSSQ